MWHVKYVILRWVVSRASHLLLIFIITSFSHYVKVQYNTVVTNFAVRIHGLAAMISFINILRAATLYNERTTFSLLFVMVSFPFLLFTILSRIIALSVISCFLEYQWTILLFLG